MNKKTKELIRKTAIDFTHMSEMQKQLVTTYLLGAENGKVEGRNILLAELEKKGVSIPESFKNGGTAPASP